jgi:predicted kinase
MTLTLMCGLSFAGKSTFAGFLATELAAEIVSLDAINVERGLDGGQGIPLDEWAKTNRLAQERAVETLGAGRDVIVDDTGSPRFVRDQWRQVAAEARAEFALVWVQIDVTRQRARVLANRSLSARSDVTDNVLDAHAADFDQPIDEDPIIVDSDETADALRVREVARRIRGSEE